MLNRDIEMFDVNKDDVKFSLPHVNKGRLFVPNYVRFVLEFMLNDKCIY